MKPNFVEMLHELIHTDVMDGDVGIPGSYISEIAYMLESEKTDLKETFEYDKFQFSLIHHRGDKTVDLVLEGVRKSTITGEDLTEGLTFIRCVDDDCLDESSHPLLYSISKMKHREGLKFPFESIDLKEVRVLRNFVEL